jgi:DNA-binding CsgD family transcriptional regulator
MDRMKHRHYFFAQFNTNKHLVMLFVFLNLTSPFCFGKTNIQDQIKSMKTLLSKYDETDSIASINSQIADAYMSIDSVAQSISHHNKAAELYLKNENYNYCCYELETIGYIYALNNNPKMALQYFIQALRVYEKNNLINMRKFSLMQNIGYIYIEAEEWKTALTILKRCESFFESDSCRYKDYLIINQINLGFVYQKIDQNDSSLLYLNLALINSNKYHKPEHHGAIYMNLGELYISWKDYKKSKYYFEQSMDLFKKSKNNRNYYRSQYGFGTAEGRSGNSNNAIEQILTAVDYFILSNDFSFAQKAYKEVADIYESQGDLKNTIKYQKLYNDIKDSIYSQNLKNQLNETELQFKLDKMDLENKTEIELLRFEAKSKNYRWVMITCILLLILSLIGTLYLKQKSKGKILNETLKNEQLEQNQLKNEINYKKNEIENLALYIVHRNDFLEQIKTDVKALKNDLKSESQSKLNTISLKITQAARKNKELEKLQENIDKINWTFIDKLTERFPELTEKEKRLCTLLKLNFNSKEIASLNNVSEEAVIKARHRMRKKMGLNSDENLTEFIHRI